MLKEQLAVLERRLQELESPSRMFIPFLNVTGRSLSKSYEATTSSFDGSNMAGTFPSHHPSIPIIPTFPSNVSSPSPPSNHLPTFLESRIEPQEVDGFDNHKTHSSNTDPHNAVYPDPLSDETKTYL